MIKIVSFSKYRIVCLKLLGLFIEKFLGLYNKIVKIVSFYGFWFWIELKEVSKFSESNVNSYFVFLLL